MTKKEIQALQLGFSENGGIVLAKQNKIGKLVPVRVITPEEASLITATLYRMFTLCKDGEKVMYLPYGDDELLAVTSVKKQE